MTYAVPLPPQATSCLATTGCPFITMQQVINVPLGGSSLAEPPGRKTTTNGQRRDPCSGPALTSCCRSCRFSTSSRPSNCKTRQAPASSVRCQGDPAPSSAITGHVPGPSNWIAGANTSTEPSRLALTSTVSLPLVLNLNAVLDKVNGGLTATASLEEPTRLRTPAPVPCTAATSPSITLIICCWGSSKSSS